MVALVQEDKVEHFIDHLKGNFYRELPAARSRDLGQVIFATQPGSGASIITLGA